MVPLAVVARELDQSAEITGDEIANHLAPMLLLEAVGLRIQVETENPTLHVPGKGGHLGLVEIVESKEWNAVGVRHNAEVLRMHVTDAEHLGEVGIAANHVTVE